jgi:hypothetical protein
LLARFKVDDNQVMIGMQRLDDPRTDKARTDHEDPHLGASVLRLAASSAVECG